MRALVSIVGKRSEHWLGLFEALAARADLELSVLAADLTDETVEGLRALESGFEGFRFLHARHRGGEDITGHMASILYGPGAFLGCPDALDAIHVIGEASYPTTQQVLRFRNRRRPQAPITLYGAQNVLQRFPPPFRSFERAAFGRVTLTTPVSADALEVMRAKGYQGPARVVPLGVDTGLFARRPHPPAGPFTIGFVGRIEKHKGIAALLEATEELGCRLLVVGEGSLRAWLEESARERGMADRVELAGWTSGERLVALMHRMHVLALPSVEIVQRGVLPGVGVVLREQFGRVLCEGMSCGLPVVGSRLGEIPRVLGPAGLTFSPGDARDLQAALARVRDEPGLGEALGAAGAERARTMFAWQQVAEALMGAWEEAARLGVAATARRYRPALAAWWGARP